MYLPEPSDGERTLTQVREPGDLISGRKGTVQADRDDLQVKVERKYINKISTGALSAHR